MGRYYRRRRYHGYGHTRGRPWTNQEESKLVQLWEDGVPITQIAQKLSRERDAIIYRLPRLGINPDDRQVRPNPRPEPEESPSKRLGTVKAPPILLNPHLKG
jgi:hypothetical protein